MGSEQKHAGGVAQHDISEGGLPRSFLLHSNRSVCSGTQSTKSSQLERLREGYKNRGDGRAESRVGGATKQRPRSSPADPRIRNDGPGPCFKSGRNHPEPVSDHHLAISLRPNPRHFILVKAKNERGKLLTFIGFLIHPHSEVSGALRGPQMSIEEGHLHETLRSPTVNPFTVLPRLSALSLCCVTIQSITRHNIVKNSTHVFSVADELWALVSPPAASCIAFPSELLLLSSPCRLTRLDGGVSAGGPTVDPDPESDADSGMVKGPVHWKSSPPRDPC